MQLVIFGAMSLLVLDPNNEAIKAAIIFFISAQACLAYLTAGLVKLVSAQWRSGQALQGVMATKIYGSQRIHRGLNVWPKSGALICWLVIVFEITFPLALFCGPTIASFYLVAGLVFHTAIAFSMGLNCFVWSFIATYPAVLWVCIRLTNSGFGLLRFYTLTH